MIHWFEPQMPEIRQNLFDRTKERIDSMLGPDVKADQDRFLQEAAALSDRADVVVPFHGGHYEPLHAVYDRRTCIPAIEASLKVGEQRPVRFLSQLRILKIEESTIAQLDPSGLSFFNINTPQELAQAEQLIADGVVALD